MRNVLAVCYDAGPAKNVGPVVAVLRDRGVAVDLFAAGPATDALDAMGVKYLPYISAHETLASGKDADMLLYAAVDCNTVMPGADIAHAAMAQGISMPICLQGDTWGLGQYRNEEWADIYPDRIFVNDRLDKRVALKAFPLAKAKNAKIFGWPWLDAYHDLTRFVLLRAAMQQKLSVPEEMPVVSFAGQLNRTGEVWTSLVRAIIALDKPVFLIARLHPAMLPDRDKVGEWRAEFERFEVVRAEFERWGRGQYALCNGPLFSPQDVIAVSDIVAGAFTTMLQEAAVCRKATIAILYRKVGLAEYRRVTQGLSEFPLVKIKCAAKAASDKKLRALLSQAYTGELERTLLPYQDKNLPADGKNSVRVADEIMKLL